MQITWKNLELASSLESLNQGKSCRFPQCAQTLRNSWSKLKELPYIKKIHKEMSSVINSFTLCYNPWVWCWKLQISDWFAWVMARRSGFRFWLGFKILWDLSKMRPRRRSRGLQSGAEGVLAVIWQTGDLDGAKHGFEHEHIKRWTSNPDVFLWSLKLRTEAVSDPESSSWSSFQSEPWIHKAKLQARNLRSFKPYSLQRNPSVRGQRPP